MRRARTCSAGTWPSTNLPSITAVWQEPRRGATPKRCFTALMSASTWSLTLKPLLSKWLIHFLQQPQLASRCTSMGISSAAWASVVVNRALSRASRNGVFIVGLTEGAAISRAFSLLLPACLQCDVVVMFLNYTNPGLSSRCLSRSNAIDDNATMRSCKDASCSSVS
ncbi:hypothetical protein PFLmoz3_02576 [Pseudomonas fluorescens]|uniref:Uncharacterized protein n=1 Tax=Pseudomonas fluorescens TaxID=294 RepID=A0A120G7W2_PSEFL|nr:hypothetical protein PFLmoz3_02576 [Pseudomonas fluorescens]